MSRHGALCCLFLLTTSPVLAQVSFDLICEGRATGVSADGSVVVGYAEETHETWRWSRDGGRVWLGRATGGGTGPARGAPDVSDDGQMVSATVMGRDSTSVAPAVWTETTGWVLMDEDRMRRMAAAGLSGDGTMIVGCVDTPEDGEGVARAVSWRQREGMIRLGGDGLNSCANDASYDGSVIVGWSEHPGDGTRQPAVWTPHDMTRLVQKTPLCEATAVSPDGSMIVGQAYDETLNQRCAALWLESDFGWIREPLGILPGAFADYGQSVALDLTSDGHIIVGCNKFDAIRSTGFVWTVGDGMMDVHHYLVRLEIDVPAGFNIDAVTGISDDGAVMTGYGSDMSSWPYRVLSFLIEKRLIAEAPDRPEPVRTGMNLTNSHLAGVAKQIVECRPQ